MKLPFIITNIFLTFSAFADIRNGLSGYYSFETHTAGVVPNTARTLGAAGFTNDGARLSGGELAGGTPQVPLSNVEGTFIAGTGALACDGTGDYADLTVAPISTATDFSVSVWFKPQTGGAGITGTARAFVLESKATYPVSFGLRAGTAGTTSFQLFTDTAGTDPSLSYNIPNGEVDLWHHLVIVYSSGTPEVKGYLDGVLRYQLTPPGPLLDITGINTGTYRGADGRWFKGFIDEEVFWQRALTETEVGMLNQGGILGQTFAETSAAPANQALRTNLTAYYGFDSHTNRVMLNEAVALGAPGYVGDAAELKGDYNTSSAVVQPLTTSAAQARAGQGALLCDGTNNYAIIDGNPVDQTQSFSISVWFKPDTGGLGYPTATDRAFVYETGTNYPISFGLRGSDGVNANFQLYTLRSDASASFQDYSVPNSEVDKWHHFLETYDSTTGMITGYLDGVATHALSSNGIALQTYSGFRMGTYRGADGRWFKGLIDEVAMWQRPLDAGEAATVYSMGSAGVPLSTDSGDINVTGFNPVAGGGYELSWATTAGLKYTIEASSDLVDWSTELAAEVAGTGAPLSFRISPSFPAPEGALYDPGLEGGERRFYRIRLKF